MKKMVFCLMASFILVLPATSFAARGWYGGANIGMAIVPDSDIDVSIGNNSGSGEISYDTGYTFGGAMGYTIDMLRIEGEISYLRTDFDDISGPGGTLPLDGDVSGLTFLFNGYLDFATGGPLTPFITAGIGYSNVDVDIYGYSDDDNLFTYQFGGGVGYAMNEAVTLDLRYRYLGFEDYEYSEPGASINVEVASHNITVGMRIAF